VRAKIWQMAQLKDQSPAPVSILEKLGEVKLSRGTFLRGLLGLGAAAVASEFEKVPGVHAQNTGELTATPEVLKLTVVDGDIRAALEQARVYSLQNQNGKIELIVPAGDYSGSEAKSYNVDASNITIVAEGEVKTKSWNLKGNKITLKGFDITDTDSDAGINIAGSDCLVEGNTVQATREDNIRVRAPGKDVTIRRNKLYAPPQRAEDPHIDFLQTWEGGDNITFEENWCYNANTSGSNQLMMISNQGGAPMKGLVIRGNIFIIDDPGYSPIRMNRQDGNDPISSVEIANNVFYNRSLQGGSFVSAARINEAARVEAKAETGLVVKNNLAVGYGFDYFPYVELDDSDAEMSGNLVYRSPSGESQTEPDAAEGAAWWDGNGMDVASIDAMLMNPEIINDPKLREWLPPEIRQHFSEN
jgi:hypothetical protein